MTVSRRRKPGALSKSCRLQQDAAYGGGVAGADTHRVEPKLDNGGIVELVNLAAHWDEAVAVLNLFDVLLPRRLCCYFAQHCLGWHAKGGGGGRSRTTKSSKNGTRKGGTREEPETGERSKKRGRKRQQREKLHCGYYTVLMSQSKEQAQAMLSFHNVKCVFEVMLGAG